jgi:hypothetical protein
MSRGATYNGTATNSSDDVTTSSGSLTTPNYLSRVYITVTGTGPIRVFTTTSGSGGVRVLTGSTRVYIGQFKPASVIPFRCDSGTATVESSCVRVVDT